MLLDADQPLPVDSPIRTEKSKEEMPQNKTSLQNDTVCPRRPAIEPSPRLLDYLELVFIFIARPTHPPIHSRFVLWTTKAVDPEHGLRQAGPIQCTISQKRHRICLTNPDSPGNPSQFLASKHCICESCGLCHHLIVYGNDWDSLSSVSLDDRHTLLLLRRHCRTAHTAHSWKAILRFETLCASCYPLTLSPLSLRILNLPRSTDTSENHSDGSEEVVAHFMVVFDPCSLTIHTLHPPFLSTVPSPLTMKRGEYNALDTSLRSNILFGSELDETRLERVVRACCFDADMKAMPDGLNTFIGKHGRKISGGQKKRMRLARVLLDSDSESNPKRDGEGNSDYSAFLNWSEEEEHGTEQEKAVVFSSFASVSDESLTGFVQSIVVLISSHICVLTTAIMKIRNKLMINETKEDSLEKREKKKGRPEMNHQRPSQVSQPQPARAERGRKTQKWKRATADSILVQKTSEPDSSDDDIAHPPSHDAREEEEGEEERDVMNRERGTEADEDSGEDGKLQKRKAVKARPVSPRVVPKKGETDTFSEDDEEDADDEGEVQRMKEDYVVSPTPIVILSNNSDPTTTLDISMF
ncbi:hypothetical protein BLNAU_17027 [Blattamonas nauphoetae]|uniref:ABC transporter domain-containing protein n=1 Tax=Blattamonas nauphoetae TaxID=2049346 RepID=A0ABQ9X9T7_9EUKA|nr:hypothetical protein BLNAU_17027 [Blattamonas nauphoetae]